LKVFGHLSVAVLMLCQSWPVIAKDEIEVSAKQIQTLGITMASLGVASAVISRQLPGEIVIPVGQERIVGAPQAGLVDVMHVAVGQSVKRGQVIGHVHSADLVALQRDYLRGKTQHQLSKNMLDRDRELYKDGIIAERRMLTTESGHQELSFEVKQLRQALKLSGMGDASISKLETQGELASGLSIVAPIEGVVIEQMASVGQRVDTSTPLYRIARIKPLWLEIHAPLDMVHLAKVGMQVHMPQYQVSGKLVTITRSVNRDDQTVHLRAEIASGAEKLYPGQYVEAELVGERASDQYAVPKVAVVRHGQQSYVFVRTAKGFVATPVTVVSEQATQSIVKGDLRGQEKVAVSGTSAIKAAWNRMGTP